ncbi:ricin-type beta-trefoil lectin domain protein [Nonomuraea sp. NPDC050536]|uniref:ricin-type beta-trefoil lectin domain protein n=1 Tax=Nonomuraea sp. NPDC050536 TaxID=3364366 RepID=UPI0037C9F078
MTHPHPKLPRPASARTRSLVCALIALLLAPIGVLATASPAAADTSQFKGVNWARPGDNFVNGPVVPEGLSQSDSYATVRAKANAIYNGFQSILGANTVRLPINTSSVPGTSWGDNYTGAIDAATARGFKVILSYWEDGASSGGRIVDMGAFNAMWNAVTAKYGANSLVYFEPMNEPMGYSATEWADVAAAWIAGRPTIPRNRIIVSGEGYNDRVTSVCADSRLNGTLLSVHLYAFSFDHDYPGWVTELKNRIGSCAARTILDEFGSPMAEPIVLNYHDSNSGEDYVRYLRAMTDTVRSLGMGSVYWPALGGKHQENSAYDFYSLFALQGSGTDLTLSTRNQSGVDRVKFGFGSGSGSTGALRNLGAGKCLDVPGATSDNVQVMVYSCNSGDNQTWTRTPSGQITVYGGTKCLDAYGQGRTNFTVVGIYDCNNGDNQKWVFNSDGTIRGVQSGLCLDVELANSQVQLYSCWGGNNQKWQAVSP